MIMYDNKKEYRVFMYTKTPPTECRCGCGAFKRLFTYDEQKHIYEIKNGKYRIFANETHLIRYRKIHHKTETAASNELSSGAGTTAGDGLSSGGS